jgi:TRAP-type C4-dicarboxylate transport system permease small subunit
VKFRLFAESLAKVAESIGVVAVIVMLSVTAIDVIGAKLFLNPLRGATELMGFAQIVAISCTIAMGLFLGRHIAIVFFVSRLPMSVQKVINTLVSCLGFFLFIVLSWQSFTYGLSLKKAGEISSSAHIPFYPFAFVIFLCAAIASLYFLNEILQLFMGRGEKNGAN